MKRLRSVALVSLLALCGCATPEFSLAPIYGPYTPSGDFSVDSGGGSADNSLADLGLDDDAGTFGFRADASWGSPHLTVSTQSSSWDGSGTLNGSFGGIAGSTAVNSEFDLSMHRAILTFDVVPTDVFELGLGFGVSLVDFDVKVEDTGGALSEQLSEALPIPMLALRAGGRIGPIELEALVAGLSVDAGGDQASYVEFDANAKYSFFGEQGSLNGSFVLGWRRIDFSADYQDGTDDVSADLTFDGPYFGLQIGI